MQDSAPKIVAEVDGREKRIFGWDVKSDSKEYTEFLDAFLPLFTAYLKKNKLQDKVYFHCSDEPVLEHLESYGKAVAIMHKHLKGFKIMDALSNVDFYKKGLVSIPVPSETHLEEFIAAGMKERWTYYCCGPTVTYSNRFIHMPSSRNRIMGTQMYYYGVEGFLHWGFNFYFSRFPVIRSILINVRTAGWRSLPAIHLSCIRERTGCRKIQSVMRCLRKDFRTSVHCSCWKRRCRGKRS